MLPQQMGYATRSLFSAVAPLTGESFHLIGFEAMDSDTECAFLTALQRGHPNEHVVVVLGNAACHLGRQHQGHASASRLQADTPPRPLRIGGELIAPADGGDHPPTPLTTVQVQLKTRPRSAHPKPQIGLLL